MTEDGEESEDDDEVEGVGFDVEPVSSDTSDLRLMQILNAHLRLLFNYVIYILKNFVPLLECRLKAPFTLPTIRLEAVNTFSAWSV